MDKLKACKASTGPTRSQKTLVEVFQQKYGKESDKYNEVTCKIAIFVGSCNVPNLLMNFDPLWRLLILDTKY